MIPGNFVINRSNNDSDHSPTRSQLFALMHDGATVITPNNRLSNQLLRDYMQHYPARVNEKPRCLPYEAFLRDRLRQLHHRNAQQQHPLLLNAAQEQLLWRQVIEQDASFPCTDSLLNAVQDAWNRCQLWQLDMCFANAQLTTQTEHFLIWHQRITNCLNQKHWITESQVVKYLLRFPVSIEASPMLWVSFDDYTPTQRALQEALTTQGQTQYHLDLEPQSTLVACYPANNPQDELDQLIAWLKSQLANKATRIAVIVPELQQQSTAIQRRLLRDLNPEHFDLSLGKALTDYPLIAHALHGLNLSRHPLSHHLVKVILQSPYFKGSRSEAMARATLLEQNPLMQETIIPYSSLLTALKPTTPLLAECLDTLTTYPQIASPHEWAQHFKKRLTHLGFPGEYVLNSSAYQCVQRLQALFDDFIQLGLIQAEMTATAALHALSNLAQSTIFQIRKSPSPIQVMGLLEASGCEFDSIWVMGMTDQCLPQRVNLSPFIPISLQRQHCMPHALPERELLLAQQLMHRLINGCRHAVFSYPRLSGDSPHLPSPLIQQLPLYTPPPATVTHPPTALTTYDETYCHPLMNNEKPSGGTTLLANQAKCPFRAFAAHRLQAKAGLKLSMGLNDAERGQLIHRVMELIWSQLHSQEDLLACSPARLDTLIKKAIETALIPAIQNRVVSCPPLIQSLERERLQRLVHAELIWEKQRPPFTIKTVEQAFTLSLAGLEFRVRVDRLDTISDHETWVIDYKSNIPSNKPWNEERPESPQLLLYALLDPSICALLFLQLKNGQVLCSGISQDKQAIPGLSGLKKDESWSDQQQRWHQRLTQLATEFREGHCPPTPQRESTCQTCEFINLCRR